MRERALEILYADLFVAFLRAFLYRKGQMTFVSSHSGY